MRRAEARVLARNGPAPTELLKNGMGRLGGAFARSIRLPLATMQTHRVFASSLSCTKIRPPIVSRPFFSSLPEDNPFKRSRLDG
jgi:hypothetical protein